MNARPAVCTLTLSAAALALAGTVPTVAQEPSPNVPVTERSRPEYDPLGIRAGGFFIFPSVTVAETYDDNVFATPDDETDDFITLISPRVRLQSNFSRHSIGATAGGDVAFYASESDENYQDAFVAADGRLDITRDSALSGGLNFGRFHEGRDDPEDVGGTEQTDLYRYGGELAFSQAFNRINFRLTGRAQRTEFEDTETAVGPDIDNSDRDNWVYDGLLRVGYFVSPRINTFVEGRYTVEDRDQDVDDAGVERGSDGWEARAGTAIDITAVLFGEAFVGFRRQMFDDPAFEDEDGISFGADLTWNVTELTTLGLSGSADFVPTTVEDAAANFRRSIGLRVDHEVLRNLLVGASARYTQDEFDAIDRTDDIIDLGASVTYLINRNFAVEGGYGFTDRSSDEATEEFSRNRVTIALTARL